jgi:excisionase family DNA binding protein
MKHVSPNEQEFFSSTEAAKILGVSRIAVFKKIKSSALKATKVGRNFIISRESLMEALGEQLSGKGRQEIDSAIKQALREYRETFRLLGQE